MTKTRLISRLWAHITDLRMYIKGQSYKNIETIETEIRETEKECTRIAQEAGENDG